MISSERPLILGSASPRRREILGGLGVSLRVVPADVIEDVVPGELPLPYLERIVDSKLRAVADKLDEPLAAILVADTTVVIDDQILGKPANVEEAEQLLRRLVGRTHTVYTRYAISDGGAPRQAVRARTVASHVTMRAASNVEIRRYAETGEGLDKAGAYAAQGIGAFLIQRIDGSYSNVVGLPACEVILDLVEARLLDRYP